MKKYKSIVKVFFILVLILLMFNKPTQAIMAKDGHYYNTVSYGIAMLLTVWKWLQYIIPIIIVGIILIINRKKLKVKNVIIFLLLGILIFIVCYFSGIIIATSSTYKGYSSTTMDMFEYNGRTIYFHK